MLDWLFYHFWTNKLINKIWIKTEKDLLNNKMILCIDIKFWSWYKINKSKNKQLRSVKTCEHLHHLPVTGHQILHKESVAYHHKILLHQWTDHIHHQLNHNIYGNLWNKSSFFLNNFLSCWNMKSVI